MDQHFGCLVLAVRRLETLHIQCFFRQKHCICSVSAHDIVWSGVHHHQPSRAHCPSFCTTHNDGQETSIYMRKKREKKPNTTTATTQSIVKFTTPYSATSLFTTTHPPIFSFILKFFDHITYTHILKFTYLPMHILCGITTTHPSGKLTPRRPLVYYHPPNISFLLNF